MDAAFLISVLHDADRWLVVEKPAGLPTQAPTPHRSLETLLRHQLGDRANYLALPHRLDVPVSGLMLVALTKKSARLLSAQFATGKVNKTYQAIVAGNASGIERSWSDQLGKIDKKAMAKIMSPGEAEQQEIAGKDAQTQVIDVNFDPIRNQTRLTLQPITGRMHQLRIGAASRGFPILGDSLYQAGQPNAAQTPEIIALRAIAIEFHDPVSGKRVKHETESLSWPPKKRSSH